MMNTTEEVGYCVGDIMRMNVFSMSKTESLLTCARTMRDKKIGALIITDSKMRPLGIVTERDMVRKAMVDDVTPSYLKAEDVMETSLITVSPSDALMDAMRLMRDHDIRHLPVVNKGKLVGFVTVKDLLSVQPELFELWAEHTTIVSRKERLLKREV